MSHEDLRPIKIGVYIPGDLARELAKISENIGVKSISRMVQEALRLYIAEHMWKTGGVVVGAIGILYDHDVENVDEVLTDTQHRFLDLVVSAIHVHLDQRNCVLLIIVKGSTEKIKSMISNIENLKGVKAVRFMLIPKE